MQSYQLAESMPAIIHPNPNRNLLMLYAALKVIYFYVNTSIVTISRRRNSQSVIPPQYGQERSIVMSASVCVFVFFLKSYLRNYMSDLHQIFMYVWLSPPPVA